MSDAADELQFWEEEAEFERAYSATRPRCLKCGDKMWQASSNRKFCSDKCGRDYRKEQSNN